MRILFFILKKTGNIIKRGLVIGDDLKDSPFVLLLMHALWQSEGQDIAVP